MTELRKRQHDLERLSEPQREAGSILFRSELTAEQDAVDSRGALTSGPHEHPKRLMQEGVDSGKPDSLDVGAVIRRDEAHWKAAHRAF